MKKGIIALFALFLSFGLTSCTIVLPGGNSQPGQPQSQAEQQSEQNNSVGTASKSTLPIVKKPDPFGMITIPGDFDGTGSVEYGQSDLSKILGIKISEINKIGLQSTIPGLPFSPINSKASDTSRSSQSDEYKPFALTVKDKDMPVLLDLGYGYDVFDVYASSRRVKDGMILDIYKLLQDGKVYRRDIKDAVYKIVTASSIKKYSQNVATTVSLSGSYMFFSASAKANFNNAHLEEANSYFSTIFYDIGVYKLYIDPATSLKDYVTADALNILETKDADFIFANYGTHVLRSLVAGGRFDYNTSIEKKYVKDEKSFSAQVRASFNMVLASANVSVDYAGTEVNETFEQKSITNIFTYGGDGVDGQSLGNDVNALKKWLKTVQNSPAISDFGDNGLIPIWEFCKTAKRKQYLQSEFEKYAAKRMRMVPTGAVINGMRLSFGSPSDNVNPEFTDQSGTWHYISNIASHGYDREARLYVRYTYDGDKENPPVVEVILEDKTIGDDAVKYFNNKYKNDPTAKLWGARSKYNITGSNLGTEINSPAARSAGAHEIRLYYVTSEKGDPIREIVFKHITSKDDEIYVPHTLEEGRKYNFVPVLNNQNKFKDISEGVPASLYHLIASRCYLLYTKE